MDNLKQLRFTTNKFFAWFFVSFSIYAQLYCIYLEHTAPEKGSQYYFLLSARNVINFEFQSYIFSYLPFWGILSCPFHASNIANTLEFVDPGMF